MKPHPIATTLVAMPSFCVGALGDDPPGTKAATSKSTVPESRVLVIGIDGTRPDALAAATTPKLDALIADGAFTAYSRILGTRYRKNDTISGPGWSSFLTDV